ncbi:MAG TPA: DUF2442 domain-containing protein [Solirubrobacterales bacterium]|nr:DUF2442 domain-containing protein [Solirubrobacterales bacterium]
MSEIVHVTSVEVVADHRLHLGFDDGVRGEVDFSDRNWRGVFERLKDPGYFSQVRVDPDMGTVVWPNGADFAPETLHRWTVSAAGDPA